MKKGLYENMEHKYKEAYYYLSAGINDSVKQIEKLSLSLEDKVIAGEFLNAISLLLKRKREAEGIFVEEKRYEALFYDTLTDINDAAELLFEIANENTDKKYNKRLKNVYTKLIRYRRYTVIRLKNG
ncbi:MAG: hypothetical protein LBC82_02925 [Oscillospiraceae bacterium]|nr:hypothetical protein [Oscillospiraceae bacterium]